MSIDMTGTEVSESVHTSRYREGSAASDYMRGEAGPDIMSGLGGDDFYWMGRGSGRDVIIESGGFDRLLVSGNRSEIALTRTGDHLRVALGPGDEQLVEGFFSGPDLQIEQVLGLGNEGIWTIGLAELRAAPVVEATGAVMPI